MSRYCVDCRSSDNIIFIRDTGEYSCNSCGTILDEESTILDLSPILDEEGRLESSSVVSTILANKGLGTIPDRSLLKRIMFRIFGIVWTGVITRRCHH